MFTLCCCCRRCYFIHLHLSVHSFYTTQPKLKGKVTPDSKTLVSFKRESNNNIRIVQITFFPNNTQPYFPPHRRSSTSWEKKIVHAKYTKTFSCSLVIVGILWEIRVFRTIKCVKECPNLFAHPLNFQQRHGISQWNVWVRILYQSTDRYYLLDR